MKLTKHEQEQKAEWEKKITAARKALQDAVDIYNTQLENLTEVLKDAVDVYNDIVNDCTAFCEDIANEIDSELEERSEKWLESDKGQAAISWGDQWKDFSCLQEDLELPDEVVLDSDDFIEEFANLTIEPEDC